MPLYRRIACHIPLVVVLAVGPTIAAEEKAQSLRAPDTDRLTDASFQTIFDALQPPKVEPWKSIPWHISILEAARQAEREGKPVFMWQADGWPLGCG